MSTLQAEIKMVERGEMAEELWYKRPKAQITNEGDDGEGGGVALEVDDNSNAYRAQMEGLEEEEEDKDEGGVLVRMDVDDFDGIV